ncbi:MAG: phosphoenolpyruvate synthase [Thermoleophilaceae bacterium]
MSGGGIVVGRALLDAGAALDAGEQRVGGKALGLARLERAGAAVPRWAVLPAEAFEFALRDAGLHERFEQELEALREDDAERVGTELRTAVEAAGPPAYLLDELDELFPDGGPFAVRSSVVGEDSAARSFAGQFDSLLFVSASEVGDAIRRCWASAFNPRALAYQLRESGSVAMPRMAVVVQEMVDGDVSGVMFTHNAVARKDDEALVTAAFGLCEGVVDGTCNTDEYVWGHDGRERSAAIADKDVEVVRDPSAGGTRQQPVVPDRRNIRALEPAEVEELARTGLRLAETLGVPQDIEWTRSGGRFVFLQSRPITTPRTSPLGDRRIVWDNSNIQESFNGVTTPLTFSVAVRSYTEVYTQTFRLLGVPESELEEYRTTLRNMIGLVRGRVYYNINNWYRICLLLPAFNTTAEDMENMMGLEEPVDFVEAQQLTARDKLRRLPRAARVAVKLGREFRRLDRSVDRFLRDFSRRTGEIDRARLPETDVGELLAIAERIQVEIFGDFTIPIVNDIYVAIMAGKLRRLVGKAIEGDAAEVVNGLLSGEPGIESKEPTRRLVAMAERICADASLEGALRDGEPSEAFAALRERSPELRTELDDYIERYGDRCMGEMKLETISLRQDPSFLVQVLRNYAAKQDLTVEKLDATERDRREQYEREVMAACGPRTRRRLRKALRGARKGVRQRENTRLARTRMVGLYRDVYTAIGERLHEAGALDAPRDVFYLSSDELVAFQEGTAITTDLAGLVRLRKAEYAEHEREELPNHFETIGSVYRGEPVAPQSESAGDARASASDGSVLRGLGCCPGIVEGELAVVRDPRDDLSINGKILTAVRTDPGWTPLFPSAAGILIERGSTLSHSAVLAREFGIPAVVGVPGLLKIVEDGERVRLDGGKGVVERLPG